VNDFTIIKKFSTISYC